MVLSPDKLAGNKFYCVEARCVAGSGEFHPIGGRVAIGYTLGDVIFHSFAFESIGGRNDFFVGLVGSCWLWQVAPKIRLMTLHPMKVA